MYPVFFINNPDPDPKLRLKPNPDPKFFLGIQNTGKYNEKKAYLVSN
jgi:hypothetical protein